MSSSLTAELKEYIRKISSGKTVFVTVGNLDRGDDGAGPYIAGLLMRRKGIFVVDAGSSPEDIIDEVLSIVPDRVIFIDAADFGGMAGEISLIDVQEIPETTVSTHSIPLNVIGEIIQQDTQAEVAYIGIQTQDVSFGAGISEDVEASLIELAEYINNYSSISE